MTPSSIAWAICMILWLICIIIERKAYKDGEEIVVSMFLVLQWVFIGFGFVFLGFDHGWW